MSNSFVVNSAGLNSSGTIAAVASLAAALFTTSGEASSYVIAGGQSQGVIATEGVAQAGQIHTGSATGLLGSSGTASGIRLAGFLPKVDYSNITGTSLNGFTYAYGGSAVDLTLSGETYPNYFIEGSTTNPGETSLETSVPVDAWRIKFSNTQPGTLALSGHLVTPRIVTITDLYVLTGLNGYCIPANELGHGYGELGTVVTCNPIRLVIGTAHVTLWGEGPVLYTNNSPYYQGEGTVATTGLTNVAIYSDQAGHWTHYYEDWLTLSIGDMTVEPKVFKNAKAGVGSLAVAVEAEPVKRARPQLAGILVQLIGSFDTEKRSGLITEPGFTGLGGMTSAEIKKTVTPIGTLGTYISSADSKVYKEITAVGTVETLVTGVGNNITSAGSSGAVNTTGSITSIRLVVPITNNSLPTTGVITPKVFKTIKESGTVPLTGTVNGTVGLRTQSGSLVTTGFIVGRKVVTEALSLGSINTLTIATDVRLAVRLNESSQWTTLVGSGNDYRTAVRLEFNEQLATTGTLFDVVNLFGRADETRQMVVAPSTAREGNSHNYMKVVA